MRTTKLITLVGFLAISLLPLNSISQESIDPRVFLTPMQQLQLRGMEANKQLGQSITGLASSIDPLVFLTPMQQLQAQGMASSEATRRAAVGLMSSITRAKEAAAQREALKQEQEHAKRLREIEYQRTLLELNQLKASSNASKPAPKPRTVNYSSAEQGVAVVCRGTSDAGFPTISAVVGSSCPDGKVKVN